MVGEVANFPTFRRQERPPMNQVLRALLVLTVTVAACGSDGKKGPGGAGGATAGGSGCDEPTGGSGGSYGGAGGRGGAGGTTGSGGAGGASTGGSGGAGGTSSGGSGGSAGAGGAAPDAAADSSAADGAGSSTDGPVLGGNVIAFYEAEAVPPNQLISGAVVGGCGATNPICPAPAEIKEGMMCCSGGKEVRQLLRGKGGLQFNGVTVAADGIYDVTWWYHCGNNDNFHDPTCRGEAHTPAGCRPGQLTVNGTVLPRTYEFPCFPGPWGQIHAATTTVPLKAGAMNSIKIATGFAINDAVDVDAIAIYEAGKGVPPSLPKSQPPGQVAK
jgi:hypothetical protein